MSKKKKEYRLKQQAITDARRFTVGKTVRLFLKSIVFALVVGLAFSILTLFEIPYLDSFWVQVGLMVVVYMLAYPFIMSEFRPETYLKRQNQR
jgi:uncharacterized membrane protein YdfJ with MMPL/SSD domain